MRRTTAILRLLSILSTFVCILAHAGVPDGFSYTPRVEFVKPPQELYHWISRYNLEKWAESFTGQIEKLSFSKKISSTSVFSNTVKILSQRKGVFTWINPIFSKQGPLHENYGSQHPALLVFEIKPNARAIRIVTDRTDGEKDLSNLIRDAGLDHLKIDLVEFITPNLHEWVLFSPKVVNQFTADPAVTLPKLKEFMDPFLKNNQHSARIEDLHFSYSEKQWRTLWSKNPHAFGQVFSKLEKVLYATPGSPYFLKESFEQSVRYENKEHFSRRSLPAVFVRPFSRDCRLVL